MVTPSNLFIHLPATPETNDCLAQPERYIRVEAIDNCLVIYGGHGLQLSPDLTLWGEQASMVMTFLEWASVPLPPD